MELASCRASELPTWCLKASGEGRRGFPTGRTPSGWPGDPGAGLTLQGTLPTPTPLCNPDGLNEEMREGQTSLKS